MREKPGCECLKLFGKSCKDCCEEMVFDRKLNPDTECNLCCCCKYDSVDYEKNEEFFCFCYKEKRKFKWFSEYISSDSQKKIIPKLIGYIFLQICSLYSIRRFDLNNKRYNYYYNDYKKLIIFFLILIASFILYLAITLFIGRHWKNRMTKDDNKTAAQKILNEIINGIGGIIFVNAIYSFIISLLYKYIGDGKYNYLFNENYYIYVTILFNKFYYFTFIYYSLSISEDRKGFELISGATLISFYLLIWDLIILILTDYVNSYFFFLFNLCFQGCYVY